MVHAEAYLLWNAACCGVSLLLGGKLAGLTTPKRSTLAACAMLSGMGALGALYEPLLISPTFFLCPFFVWICYRENGMPACLRALVGTICAALLIGGGATLLMSFGYSAALSMSLAALLALLLWTLSVLLPSAFCEVKQVEISYGGQSVLLPAMLDSGNLVRDPLSRQPVVVVSERSVRPLFPDIESLCALEELPEGFRLLRVRTAAGSGLWPLFRPDACRVYINGRVWDANAVVAVAGKSYSGIQALVPLGAVPSAAAAAIPDSAASAAV